MTYYVYITMIVRFDITELSPWLVTVSVSNGLYDRPTLYICVLYWLVVMVIWL